MTTVSNSLKQALGACAQGTAAFSCPHLTVPLQQQGNAWMTWQGAPEEEHFWV